MNKKRIASLAAVLVFVASAQGQDFINLDFESAQNLPTAGGLVAVTNALPGWTVFYGTNQSAQILLNRVFLEGVTLQETNSNVISGNFSVTLAFPGYEDDGGDGGFEGETYISQTGLVPISAESLLFEMHGAPYQYGTSLIVSLGGQDLSYSAISTGSDYTLYGANIPSEFAGQMKTLTFSTLRTGIASAASDWILDDIQFSPSPVPEPSEFALASLGLILFGIRHWWKSRRINMPLRKNDYE